MFPRHPWTGVAAPQGATAPTLKTPDVGHHVTKLHEGQVSFITTDRQTDRHNV